MIHIEKITNSALNFKQLIFNVFFSGILQALMDL